MYCLSITTKLSILLHIPIWILILYLLPNSLKSFCITHTILFNITVDSISFLLKQIMLILLYANFLQFLDWLISIHFSCSSVCLLQITHSTTCKLALWYKMYFVYISKNSKLLIITIQYIMYYICTILYNLAIIYIITYVKMCRDVEITKCTYIQN